MQPPEQHTNYAPSQFRMLQKPDVINNPQYTEDEYGQYSQKSACELCPGKNCKGCSISPDGINYIGNIHTLEDMPEEIGYEVTIAIKQGGFAEKAARWKDPNDTSIPPHIKNRDVANFAFYKPEINTTFGGQLKQNGDIALVVVKGNQLKTIAQTAPKLTPEILKPSSIPSPASSPELSTSYDRKDTERPSKPFIGGTIKLQEQPLPTQEYRQDVAFQQRNLSQQVYEQTGSKSIPGTPRNETKTSLQTKIQTIPQQERDILVATSQIQEDIQSTDFIFIPKAEVSNWLKPQDNTWELTVPDRYQVPLKPSRKRYSRDTSEVPVIPKETPSPLEPISSTPFEKMIQTHTEAKHMVFEFLTELVPQSSVDSIPNKETQAASNELILKQAPLEITTQKPLQLIKQFLTASGAQEKSLTVHFTPTTNQEEVVIDYILPTPEQAVLFNPASPPEQSILVNPTSTPEQILQLEPMPQNEQAVLVKPTASTEQTIIRLMSNKRDKETTIILSETAAKTIIHRLKTYVSSQILTEDIEIAPQEDHSRIANIVSPHTNTFIGLIVIATLLFINQLLTYSDTGEQSNDTSFTIPL